MTSGVTPTPAPYTMLTSPIRAAQSSTARSIQSQAPRLDLALSDAMQQNSVIAGFVDGNKNSGFCMLNNSVTLRSVIPSAIQLHAFAKNKTAIIGRG